MKNLIFSLLFLPAISLAGTHTTYYAAGGGTIVIATGTVAAAPAGEGVVIDTTSLSVMAETTTPLQWNHTFTGNYLYAVVQCRGINSLVTGVTVGGSAASLLQSHSEGTEHGYQYGLVNPGTGSKQISVAYSAGNDSNMNCACISFTGVAASDSVDVTTGSYVNGQEFNTIARNTTTNTDMLIDLQFPATGTKDAGQTQAYRFINAIQGADSYGSYKLVGAAGSQSMTWSVNWSASILMWVALKPQP